MTDDGQATLPGMHDPYKGRLDIDGAEEMLGITEESREYLRQSALLRIIQQRLEITEAEVDQQYEQSLKEQLRDARATLNSLVRGGLDE